MPFGPKNAREARIYAEEGLRVDFQHMLQKELNRRKMTRARLAQRAGMTEQQMSQLFSSRCNPTLRTVARLFHAISADLKLQLLTALPNGDPQKEG